MTPEERAILTVERFSCHSALRTGGTAIEDVTEYFEQQITEAIREARRDAIKEAAELVWPKSKTYLRAELTEVGQALYDKAALIRALLTPAVAVARGEKTE